MRSRRTEPVVVIEFKYLTRIFMAGFLIGWLAGYLTRMFT